MASGASGRHATTRSCVSSGAEEASPPEVPGHRAARGRSRSRRPGRRATWPILRHPLTAICAVQAALSLTLVWGNTAFTDEADYLRLGHLVIGHWLHGTSWPAGYGDKVLSGSPVIYPPLGAIADSAGGLAGARILSLAFMLAATVLVYRTASRLLGRSCAIIAAALWALSEPVLRLAFATYDPMSVFLVALAAWLAVLAGYRRSYWVFVLSSAAALALAAAVAYSAIAIAPVVIALAFLTWWHRFDTRLAASGTATLTGAALAIFAVAITASGSWSGIAFTVLNRKVNDYQSVAVILGDVARFSGLIVVVALIGAALATREPGRRLGVLVVVLGGAALVVPAAQLYMRTAWALDKHLAYGIWFASIAGGYGCLAGARWLRGAAAGRRVVLAAGAAALAVATAVNWQLASLTFRSWPNAGSFVAAFEPAAARNHGLIFASAQKRVAAYYAPAGAQWWLWKVTDLSLDPPGVPRGGWYSYYASRIRTAGYGLIALFYARPPAMRLPGSTSVGPAAAARISSELAGLDAMKLSEPGVRVLTRALAHDSAFRLVAVGRYDSAAQAGVYAIWLSDPAA